MCIILRIYIYIIYKTIKLSLQQRGIHSTKDDIKKKTIHKISPRENTGVSVML